MSYCRVGTKENGVMSDVYTYADVGGGWTTHVAENRYVGPELFPDFPADEHYVPIGLPFDGYSFNDPTPGATADRLLRLRDAGYNVPQSAINRLRYEEEVMLP